MSKTLTNLRTGVRMYLDEANQADYTDTEVDREINYAYQDLAGKVMEVYEEFYNTVTKKTYATVANQQEYTLDTTLLKITRVECNYKPSDSNNRAVRLAPIKIDSVQWDLADPNKGSTGIFGGGYYVNGEQSVQEIGLIPIPTEAGASALSVWGMEAPTDLSSSSDSVKIPYPDRFAKLIEIKAAAELLKKGQQEVDAAKDLIANYRIGVLDMQTFIKERQSDGAWMIEDSQEDTDMENPL